MHYRANPQPASYCTTCWYETPETSRDHNKIVPSVYLLYSGPREDTMRQRHSNQAPSLTLIPSVKLSWGQVVDIAQHTFSIRKSFAYLYVHVYYTIVHCTSYIVWCISFNSQNISLSLLPSSNPKSRCQVVSEPAYLHLEAKVWSPRLWGKCSERTWPQNARDKEQGLLLCISQK